MFNPFVKMGAIDFITRISAEKILQYWRCQVELPINGILV